MKASKVWALVVLANMGILSNPAHALLVDNFIDEGTFSAQGSSVGCSSGNPTCISNNTNAVGYVATQGDGPQPGGFILGGYRSEYFSNLIRDSDGQSVAMGNSTNGSALPPNLIFNDSTDPGVSGLTSKTTFVWDGVNHTVPSPTITNWGAGYQAVDTLGMAPGQDLTQPTGGSGPLANQLEITLAKPFGDIAALINNYVLSGTQFNLQLWDVNSNTQSAFVSGSPFQSSVIFNFSMFNNVDISKVTALELSITGPAGYRVAINSLETTRSGTVPEPASMSLIAAGLMGMSWVNRRRQRASA